MQFEQNSEEPTHRSYGKRSKSNEVVYQHVRSTKKIGRQRQPMHKQKLEEYVIDREEPVELQL